MKSSTHADVFEDRCPTAAAALKTERTSKTSSGAPRQAESVINTERRQEHGQWHSLDNENGQLGEIVPRPQPQPAQQAHTEDGEDLEDFVWRTKAGRVGHRHRTSSGAQDRSPTAAAARSTAAALKTERTSKTSSGAPRRAESVINTERRQEHGQWHSLDNENGQLAEIVPRPQPQPAQQAHTEDGEDLEDFVWRAKAGRVGHQHRTSSGARPMALTRQ
ncbi:hypothetical protein B0H13DRAFT_2664476 [Mycena leptocephala]|nr:hypothetical protein B0H13DRAFT_2682976 [Mycena leptocephala]KAJ7898754.1 hypothetical protein B0H13DRAFT_2664476 [Mycena leptocephala]